MATKLYMVEIHHVKDGYLSTIPYSTIPVKGDYIQFRTEGDVYLVLKRLFTPSPTLIQLVVDNTDYDFSLR